MELIIISTIVFIASLAGTLSGFGIATLLVPATLLFFPLAETLLFVGIMHWFNDVWKLTLFRGGINWRLILLFGGPGVFASYAGASLVVKVPESLLLDTLGGILVIYAIYLFFNPEFRVSQGNVSMIAGGTLSGFTSGLIGIGGEIRGAFLSAFNFPKEVYIATAGAVAFFVDVTRVSTYLLNGIRLEDFLLWGLVIFVPMSFLGAKTAKLILNRIPQKYFRVLVGTFLGIVGVYFLMT